MENTYKPNVRDILERLKRRFGAPSYRHLASDLGVSASTLSSWRQRNSMPYSFCVDLALTEGFSLDWLILGQERDGMDVHAIILAFTHIQRISKSSGIDIESVSAAYMAEYFAEAYDRFVTLLNNETEKGRSREEAAASIGEVMEALSQVPVSWYSRGGPLAPVRGFGAPMQIPTLPDIKPGPEHISPEQVKTIQELNRVAADHDIAAGRSEGSALLSSLKLLNRQYGVPDIRLIPKKYGDDAIEYMEKRVDRLRSNLNGADYVAWRTELYLAIYARARDLGYSMDKLYSIAFDQSGKRITTLKELNDQELKELHSVITSTER